MKNLMHRAQGMGVAPAGEGPYAGVDEPPAPPMGAAGGSVAPGGPGPAGPGAPPAPVQGDAQGPGGAPAPGAGVTPEMQREYTVVVSNAVKYLHGPGREPALQKISSSPRPVEQAGVVAGDVVAMQIQGAAANGVHLQPRVLFGAVREVLGVTLELGTAAGALQEADQQATNRAFVAASMRVTSAAQQAGLFSEQEIQRAQQMLAEYQQRAQAGGAPPQQPPAPAAAAGGPMA